jgi:bifunctional non-homologous end joining protein LigD
MTGPAASVPPVDDIEVTHPERVLFPDDGITKGDVVAYYRRVAPLMLPRVAGRPLVLERFREGIDRPGFIQKEADALPDWITKVTVDRRGGGSVTHAVADNESTLVYLANLGSVSLHHWLSRADDVERPDQIIFDLDPSDDLAAVVLAARWLHELLDELDLPSFPKVSGSRGIHVHVPIQRTVHTDDANQVALGIATVLAARHPDELTVHHRKAARGDRLFIDTLRNGYAQHAVAAYSVRPKPGAPVAVPIGWDEVVPGLDARRYTIRNLFRRLGQRADPWEGLDAAAVDVSERGWRRRLGRLLGGDA